MIRNIDLVQFVLLIFVLLFIFKSLRSLDLEGKSKVRRHVPCLTELKVY